MSRDCDQILGIIMLTAHSFSAAAITIVRTTKLPADLQKNANIVYQFVMFFVWNSLEVNALIISCCIPTLVPLWELVRGRGASKYRKKVSRDQKTYDSKRSYGLSSIGQKKAIEHNLDREVSSSRIYINIDAYGNGKSFNEEGENKFEASISTQSTMSQPVEGIHVTREVDIRNTNC